jgi:class 3 adenylate cyclase
VAAGDTGWRDLLAMYQASVRVELERFRGREVYTAGDGVLAVSRSGAVSTSVKS